MKDQIEIELKRLEQQHDIKILYAVESGSRAWGFASTDSDWDVRFVYLHNRDWYLSIDDKSDSLEEILPNNIDLSGWELRKTLKLFRKSNPPLLEWLRSPIIYLEQFSTADNLRQLTGEFFNPKSCLHHYLHMAEGNFKEYLQKDEVRVKKYFYVLRPILACQWIEQTDTMAPMEFQLLVDTLVADKQLKNEIEKLLTRKINGEELNEEPRIQILNDFLDEKITYFNNLLKNFDTTKQPDTTKLNDLFRMTLQEVYELNGFVGKV
jgi:predicted nucleotidyltransferase